MPWITDAQLKSAVASVQGLASPSDVASHWDDSITAANVGAYNWLRAKLAGRGFSPAQMDSWDAKADYNRAAALCRLYREYGLKGVGEANLIVEQCKSLEELDTLDVTAGGEVIEPGATGAGSVSHGSYTTTCDRHTMDDTL
jgi:hypothetical protein